MLKVYFRIFATQLSFVSAIVLLTSLTALCQDVQSQYDKGTPPQHVAGVSGIGSYISVDLGTVNLSNGSLNFKIPLGQIGGRGFSIPLTLNYSSKIWSARKGNEFILDLNATRPFAFAIYNDPDQFHPLYSNIAPGWGLGAVPVLKAVSNEQAPVHNPSNGCDEFALMLNKLTLSLPDKGEVQFRDDLTDGKFLNTRGLGTPPCRWKDGYRGARWHATDGSGMIFISDQDDGVSLGNLSGTVIAADSTRYRFIDPNPGALYLLKKSVRCVSITDRNGNQITIQYVPGQVIGQDSVIYTDQLGRQTRIDFNVTDTNGDPLAVRVQLPGYNGAVRYCKIKTGVMNLHYSAGVNPVLPVINGDFDSQGYGYGWPGPHTSLFPSSYGSGAERIDNKKVLTQVILPDSRSLSFAYNEFGEVAEVTLPTGGKIQYDYAHVSTLPSGNSANFEINPTPPYIGSNVSAIDRAITIRRAYPDGVNLENTCTYTYSATIGVGGSATNGMTEVKEVSGSNTLLWRKHYFRDAKRYLTGSGGTGYALWSTGLERRSETLNSAGGIMNASEQDWTQRAPVVWTGYTPETQEQPENDNRVNQTRKYLDTGSFARTDTLYDHLNNVRANNVKETLEYDFNQTLKRRAVNSYLTVNPDNGLINYSTDDIFLLRLPTQQSVYDSGGTERARTVYQYDMYANDGNNATLTDYGPSVTGRDAAYGSGKTTRGNVTAVGRWLDTNGSTLFTYSRYDTLGNVVSTKDPRGNVITISYADNFGAGDNPDSGAGGDFGPTFAFPTLITSPPPNPGEPQHTAKSQYDFSTGLLTGFKDRNGVVAKTEYNDPFNRPTRIINAKGVTGVETQTAMYYAPQSNPYGVTLERNDVLTAKDRDASGDGALRSWTVTDGFGRTIESLSRHPQGDVKVTTIYDGLGRVSQTSNPHRSGETPVYATTTYDLAGRVTAVTTPDGASVSTVYNDNQVTVTDQAGKKRRIETDALGRLVKVTEDPGEGGLNYDTTYLYDPLDNLRAVNQGGQGRWFSYDSLSRLIRVRNMEQDCNPYLPPHTDPFTGSACWSSAYSYDANGNLVSKTDPRNITTNYTYDALNRNTSVDYSNTAVNPDIRRQYDGVTNGKGRFWADYAGGFNPTDQVGEHNVIGSYDALGRPLTKRHLFKVNGVWSAAYSVSQTYDLAGNVKTLTYPSGHTVNYSHDQAGRLSSFSGALGGSPSTYADTISYNAAGQVIKERFGTNTSLYHNLHYNNRLQLVSNRLGDSATDEWNWSRGALGFLYGATAVAGGGMFANDTDNNGNLRRQITSVPLAGGGHVIPQVDDYTYDALNRISSFTDSQVDSGGQWIQAASQSYSYDRYGNRRITSVSGGVNNYNPSYDQTTNRINGLGYDAAGNIISDPMTGGTMTYDAENRILTATNGVGGSYTYDADGRRVRRIIGGLETWHVYGYGGELLAEYAAGAAPSAAQKEYGYRNGQLLVVWDGGETGDRQLQWLVQDHLGSTRMVVDRSGSLGGVRRHDFLPFGEELFAGVGIRSASLGYGDDSVRQKFGSKERDIETGLDFFEARYFSSMQGRFTSPDEFKGGPRELFILGSGSPTKQALPFADITNPQSLNKYQYCYNNPLRYVDPDGHDPEDGFWERMKQYVASLYKNQVEWKTGEEEQEQKYPNPGGIPDGDKIVEAHFYAITTTNSVLSNIIVLADPTGASGTVKSFMEGDKTGVAIGMVGIVSGLAKFGLTLTEAKGFVGAWGKGTFDTTSKLIQHSFQEHKAKLGVTNVWDYMRKAAGFNTKGAARKVYEEGRRVKYTRKDGTFIIKDEQGKIVSYGRN